MKKIVEALYLASIDRSFLGKTFWWFISEFSEDQIDGSLSQLSGCCIFNTKGTNQTFYSIYTMIKNLIFSGTLISILKTLFYVIRV